MTSTALHSYQDLPTYGRGEGLTRECSGETDDDELARLGERHGLVWGDLPEGLGGGGKRAADCNHCCWDCEDYGDYGSVVSSVVLSGSGRVGEEDGDRNSGAWRHIT